MKTRCQVTQVTKNGIAVVLEDGRKGRIRKQEISWERRISVPVQIPQPGDRIEAVILNEQVEGKWAELSIRRLFDPWVGAASRYRIKQSVSGEVINVQPEHAFIQLEPGIDASLLPQDAPLLNTLSLPDVLRPGDKIRAVIESIDVDKRQIALSLVKQIQGESDAHDASYPNRSFGTGRDQKTPITSLTGAASEVSFQPKGFFQANEHLVFSNRSRQDILTGILEKLLEETGVAFGFILQLNAVEGSISVVASLPPLEGDEISSWNLFSSPAREVIEDGTEFVLDDRKLHHPRLRNLFPTINYRSALGIPIHLHHYDTQYGLFLLDDKKGTFDFSQNRKKNSQWINARLAASYIAMAIERTLLIEEMENSAYLKTLGQLFFSFIHEMNNKLNSLQFPIMAVERGIHDLQNKHNSTSALNSLPLLMRSVEQISEDINDLRELLDSNTRLVKQDFDSVDVNQVAHQIARQLSRTATEHSVNLGVDLENNLPGAICDPNALKQALLNLALNAIQMSGRFSKELIKVSEIKGYAPPILRQGKVLIQTVSTPDGLIRIRVIDNGPGVHFQDRERIFRSGFSRRGAAGLGLYISRMIIERMYGRLYLLDSILFSGSVFVIELPVAPKQRTEG